MNKFDYIIIGGGVAAYHMIKSLREHDKKSSVALLSAEQSLPYDRPALSKDLWLEEDSDSSSIKHELDSFGIKAFLGHKVEMLAADKKMLVCNHDMTFAYDKLILATGGSPIKLENAAEGVVYYRDLQDYKKLRDLAKKHNDFAVIGGGYIGPEIAAVLTANKKQVSMIFPEETIASSRFPKALSKHIDKVYKDQGVKLLSGMKVSEVSFNNDLYTVKTEDGSTVEAEVVVAGLGIKPNIELAKQAKLKLENDGIWVNEYLQTSKPDIYAIGDVASFCNLALAKRMRVEHEDNARVMGKLVGANLAGEREPYDYLPYFYSDMFDMSYEALGEVSTELETFTDATEDFEQAVIYYLQDKKVRGVLLWNVWEKKDQARALIESKESYSNENLKGEITFS